MESATTRLKAGPHERSSDDDSRSPKRRASTYNRPTDGSVIRQPPDRLPRARGRRGRTRSRQGTARVGGDRVGRSASLERAAFATGSSTTRTSSTAPAHAGRKRKGPSRCSAGGLLPARRDQLLVPVAVRASWPTKRSPRTCRCFADRRAKIAYRPYPVAGVSHPLELYPRPLPRGRDPGARRGMFPRHQAVGVHPADADGARSRLEGGPRRPGRVRRRQRHGRDRRRTGCEQLRLHPVHRVGGERGRSS